MFYYVDTDTINNALSRQEVQRLRIESEKKTVIREYDSYRLMRGIVTSMLLRNSLDTLGLEWSYLFYKELSHYKAPERILRPHILIISTSSHNRIKGRIIQKQLSEIIDICNESEKHIKRVLNKLYGRENIYDS